MDCEKAQELITNYVHDKLDKKDTLEFIKHIQECNECKSELLEYYALIMAMRQIDNDEDIQLDYSESLDNKMETFVEECKNEKVEKNAKRFMLLFIVTCICAIFTFI